MRRVDVHSFHKLERLVQALVDRLDLLETRTTETEDTMSRLDDALNTLTNAVADHELAVQKEIDALKEALANNDPAAANAAADRISQLSSKIADETAALAASLPPPAAP